MGQSHNALKKTLKAYNNELYRLARLNDTPGALEAEKRNQLAGMSKTDKALMMASMSGIPGVSDVAGLASDARMYSRDPSSRTPGNALLTGLGALPLVPGMASVKKAGNVWHEGTKVIDEAGNPMTMYHGSPEKFSALDSAKANKNDPDIPVVGFHFVSSKKEAETAGLFPWGRPNSPTANVLEAHLLIKNPATRSEVYRVQRESKARSNQEVTDALIARGYDGVAMKKHISISPEQRVRIAKGERVQIAPGKYLEGSGIGAEGSVQVDYYTDSIGHVTGYDSVDEFLELEGNSHYVAFSPDQVKPAK
jgi:hypothetical protein